MRRRLLALAVVLLAALLVLLTWWSRLPASSGEAGDPELLEKRGRAQPQGLDADPALEGAVRAASERAPVVPDPTAGTDRSRTLEEQARALRDNPDVHVICAIDPALDEARAYLAVGEPGSFNGRMVQVILGEAYLPFLAGEAAPADAPAGWLSVEGYAPTPVRWSVPTDRGPGRCLGEPVVLREGGTVLTGVVRHAEGGDPAAGAWVEGCGGLGMTDADGHYYMEVVAAPCTVLAMRQDGMLRTRGPAEEVSPVAGEDTVVDLAIPGFKRAGLGAMVALTDLGVEIQGVLPGGSADEVLEPGDIVLQVEGEDTVDMSLGEFVDRVGGREGTTILLTVLRGEEELEVELERRQVRDPEQPEDGAEDGAEDDGAQTP